MSSIDNISRKGDFLEPLGWALDQLVYEGGQDYRSQDHPPRIVSSKIGEPPSPAREYLRFGRHVSDVIEGYGFYIGPGRVGIDVSCMAVAGMVASCAGHSAVNLLDEQARLARVGTMLKDPRSTAEVVELAKWGRSKYEFDHGQLTSTPASAMERELGMFPRQGDGPEDLSAGLAIAFKPGPDGQHFKVSDSAQKTLDEIKSGAEVNAVKAGSERRSVCPRTAIVGRLFNKISQAACQIDSLVPSQLRGQTTGSGLIIL